MRMSRTGCNPEEKMKTDNEIDTCLFKETDTQWIADTQWAARMDVHPLPAPHSRGVERDRDMFRAGYEAAIEDYLKAKDKGEV